MKPTLCTRIILVLICSMNLAADAFADERVLRLLNWQNYIDPDVLREFEASRGVTVREYYFNSDTDRDLILAEAEGRGFDLTVLNGGHIAKYRKLDWLAPVDETSVPNLRYADATWRNAFVDANGFAVPLTWGTLGIAYRKDLVPRPIESWMDLLIPTPALCGRIVMGGDARDIVGMALKAVGVSLNSRDDDAYRRAEALLYAQRKCVAAYEYPLPDGDNPLFSGAVLAAMMFNGDAATVTALDSRVTYVVPKEGTVLWIDYLVVMSASPQRELALDLVNFLQEPRNAARTSVYSRFASTNGAVFELLPERFRNDPQIFPADPWGGRFEVEASLDARSIKTRNLIFSRLKRVSSR